MLFLPPEGRNLTVQDLDRPPLGHNRDGTSAPANATPAGPGQAATRRDPSRPPSPNRQPGNVSPKATRKLCTQNTACSTDEVGGDADTVGGDADTVDDDLDDLNGDVTDLQDGDIKSVQTDLSNEASDLSTLRGLGRLLALCRPLRSLRATRR